MLDAVAQRYSVRPSELLRSEAFPALLDIAIAVKGFENEKKQMDEAARKRG